MYNVRSSTGVVHKAYARHKGSGTYVVACSNMIHNWKPSVTRNWEETHEPVTCQNCLQFEEPKTDPQPRVRYDFVWRHVDPNMVRAEVTRSEWPEGYNITNIPSLVTKFQMEVEDVLVRAMPMPGEKSFRRPPEEEREYLFAMAKAYQRGRLARRDHSYWVYK